MKEKLLSVGKFVIIKYIFKKTDLFDFGVLLFVVFYLNMHQTGMWAMGGKHAQLKFLFLPVEY